MEWNNKQYNDVWSFKYVQIHVFGIGGEVFGYSSNLINEFFFLSSFTFRFPKEQIGGFRLPNGTFNGLFGLVADQVIN